MAVEAKTSDSIPTVYADGGALAPIPDDVTIPQFLFDGHHPLGGQALHERPPAWFIEDATGREVTGDQVRARVWGLANAMSIRWNIGEWTQAQPHITIMLTAVKHGIGDGDVGAFTP